MPPPAMAGRWCWTWRPTSRSSTRGASPASKGEARADEIVSIQFAGPVTALATLRCSIRPRDFIDLLTLVHVDGRWQVIAKVFHWDEPPAVAGH